MPTKIHKLIPLTLLSLFILIPNLASAHQPRIVESRQTIVPNPEVSKA
jgi:hypothetical protein